MDITDNHTIYIMPGGLSEAEVADAFEDALGRMYANHKLDLRQSKLQIKLFDGKVENRNYGYVYVCKELYHVINGQNPDGSPRTVNRYTRPLSSFERIPDIPDRIMAQGCDVAFDYWADLNAKCNTLDHAERMFAQYDACLEHVSLPPLFELNFWPKDDARKCLIIMKPATVRSLPSNINYELVGYKVPVSVTNVEIWRRFNPYVTRKVTDKRTDSTPSVHGGHLYTIGKQEMRDIFLGFHPCTNDAQFALLFQRQSKFGEHLVSFAMARS